MVRDLSCGGHRIHLEVDVRRVDCVRCGGVKRERLEWLAENPRYTRRFAMLVGRRCRTATIKDVARELHLHWETVKELEKEYLAEQLRRVGSPAPEVIGIDEISIRKGHTYRIPEAWTEEELLERLLGPGEPPSVVAAAAVTLGNTDGETAGLTIWELPVEPS